MSSARFIVMASSPCPSATTAAKRPSRASSRPKDSLGNVENKALRDTSESLDAFESRPPRLVRSKKSLTGRLLARKPSQQTLVRLSSIFGHEAGARCDPRRARKMPVDAPLRTLHDAISVLLTATLSCVADVAVCDRAAGVTAGPSTRRPSRPTSRPSTPPSPRWELFDPAFADRCGAQPQDRFVRYDPQHRDIPCCSGGARRRRRFPWRRARSVGSVR